MVRYKFLLLTLFFLVGCTSNNTAKHDINHTSSSKSLSDLIGENAQEYKDLDSQDDALA